MKRMLVVAVLCLQAYAASGCVSPMVTGGSGMGRGLATQTATSTPAATSTASVVVTASITTSASPEATPSARTVTAKSKAPDSPSKKLHHPATGSPERKALMDGLRPKIQRDLGMKVIFKVYELNVANGFAFVQAEALTPSGNPVDYRKTKYKKLFQDGDFDTGGNIYALLRYRSGSWDVRTFVIGPTDVAYATWWRDYGAPKSIFPYTE
jgi:hypothetical protein